LRARDLAADDRVVFFFVLVVCPSDETAMSEASPTTATVRSVRYKVVLMDVNQQRN
jgi:hypothetical protein